jgi:membrane-bound lytic murein transglycosylase B
MVSYGKILVLCFFLICGSDSASEYEKAKKQFTAQLKLWREARPLRSEFLELVGEDELKMLFAEAIKKKLDPALFHRWLMSNQFFKVEEKVLRYYAEPRHSEKEDQRNKKNSSSVISVSGLEKQKNYYFEYKKFLSEIESEYGVNPAILVSLYYTETRFSKGSLPHRALDVFFSQLVYLREFFQMNPTSSEDRLERLLRLARFNLISLFEFYLRSGVESGKIRASWAGACGPLQFMPMNFKYYVDGNRDHSVELENPVDGLASAALYLKSHGWNKDAEELFKRGKWDNEKLVGILKRYNPNTVYAKGVLKAAHYLYLGVR